jgi:MoxR-like ATPase
MTQFKSPALIGPAAAVLAAARAIAAKRDPLALLLDGDPGVGKTLIADTLALELTGSPHAIERVNGQSVSADLVREWRITAGWGNLFSARTVKRIDEIDKASTAGVAELLTHLDYLPRGHAVLATTNDFAALRSSWKGRLETRFIRLHVDAPAIAEIVPWLIRHCRIAAQQAQAIARGAVPDGMLDGVNVRAALLDAEALVAVQELGKPCPTRSAVKKPLADRPLVNTQAFNQ